MFDRTTRLDKPIIREVSSREPRHARVRPAQFPAADEVASYIAQMTAEMGQMAAAVKLEMLAYLLGMAHLEAEMIAFRETLVSI